MSTETKVLKRDYRKYLVWVKKTDYPILSYKNWIRREIAHNTRYGVLAKKVGYVCEGK